jgi:exonuclease VII small subunit
MNIEELEREHEKVLLALEQEIEGWKSANRILKAHLEQAEKALQLVVEDMEADTHVKYDGEEFVLVYKSSAEYIAAKQALKAIRGN